MAVNAQFTDILIVLTPETDFRNNDEFDSLIGMSILVIIKDNFSYDMSVAEFLNCKTPSDLYEAIKKHE